MARMHMHRQDLLDELDAEAMQNGTAYLECLVQDDDGNDHIEYHTRREMRADPYRWQAFDDDWQVMQCECTWYAVE